MINCECTEAVDPGVGDRDFRSEGLRHGQLTRWRVAGDEDVGTEDFRSEGLRRSVINNRHLVLRLSGRRPRLQERRMNWWLVLVASADERQFTNDERRVW